LEKTFSYTPWDIELRRILSRFRPPFEDAHVYDLKTALSTEMRVRYKLFWLRLRVNPFWAGLTLRRGLEHGALMFAACRKEA
jgi:hypothetical protein